LKKILTALSLITAFCISAGAYAGDYAKKNGGFKQDLSQMPVSTVQDAQNMSEDTMVMLQGNISKRVKKDQYLFNDNTGEMIVEIEGYAWNGQEVSPTDVITIVGEIDKDGNMTMIEVDDVIVNAQK